MQPMLTPSASSPAHGSSHMAQPVHHGAIGTSHEPPIVMSPSSLAMPSATAAPTLGDTRQLIDLVNEAGRRAMLTLAVASPLDTSGASPREQLDRNGVSAQDVAATMRAEVRQMHREGRITGDQMAVLNDLDSAWQHRSARPAPR